MKEVIAFVERRKKDKLYTTGGLGYLITTA
jgi:hypothetical protein